MLAAKRAVETLTCMLIASQGARRSEVSLHACAQMRSKMIIDQTPASTRDPCAPARGIGTVISTTRDDASTDVTRLGLSTQARTQRATRPFASQADPASVCVPVMN
jgi:hypothetical protein